MHPYLTQILDIYAAWAANDMMNINSICPPEISDGLPIAAQIDDDDFQDDTLTGGNTSHVTNIQLI